MTLTFRAWLVVILIAASVFLTKNPRYLSRAWEWGKGKYAESKVPKCPEGYVCVKIEE